MNPTIVTAATPVIDLARARLHCKIAGTDRDLEITDAVEAARAWAQEWLGVAIGPQRLAWTFDSWCGSATLPYDITAVVSVVDASGPAAYVKSGRTIRASSTAAPVVITIDCGFTAAALPGPIKSAMLLVVGDLIRNQQAQVEAELYQNRAVENLLALYRERLHA